LAYAVLNFAWLMIAALKTVKNASLSKQVLPIPAELGSAFGNKECKL
jgi:hypothetical protein